MEVSRTTGGYPHAGAQRGEQRSQPMHGQRPQRQVQKIEGTFTGLEPSL